MRQNGLVVLAALAMTILSADAQAAEHCKGKVTEVTVTEAGLVATRTSAITLEENRWWLSVCNLETGGATCNGMLSSLQTAVASGADVNFHVTISDPVEGQTCAGTSSQATVHYVKLFRPPYVQ